MIGLLLSITALAWDGERLYVARPGGVDVYRDGRIVATLGDEARVVMGLSARGTRVAECGGRAGERGEVRVWEEGRLLFKLEAHDDLVYRVAWSADGKLLYTAGGDRRIGVVDVAAGKVVEFLEGHTGPVLALAVHGELLVSGGADRTIRVWKNRRLVRSIPNHWEAVNALAFSPDGKYLASGSSDRTVRIWQPEIGRLVRIIRGHEGPILDLAWGEQLVSASADGKVRLMASDDVAILKVLEGHGDWVNAVCLAGPALWSGASSGPPRSWLSPK